MKKTLIAAGLALAAGVALADASPLPPGPAYALEQARIEAGHEADRRACRRLKGHARDLCETQAEGRRDSLLAKLEARHDPDPEKSYEAKMVTARAHYDIARVKCKALEGKARRDCMKQAKAAREAAQRQAVVEKVESTGGIFARDRNS